MNLSPRQSETLALIQEGLSNKEIARRMHISYPTVKVHVSEILRRFGVRNRVEAAVMGAKERDGYEG